MIRIPVPDNGAEPGLESYLEVASVEAGGERLAMDAADGAPELAVNLLVELESEERVRKPFFAIGAPESSLAIEFRTKLLFEKVRLENPMRQ